MSSNKKSLSPDAAKKKFPTLKTKELLGHKQKVHSVAWNIKGKLASGSVDQTARVWDIERSHTAELELKGHTKSIHQLCFDPTRPNNLATCSADKSVKIWDIKSGKCISTISTNGENINIAYKPDGSRIAVGNKEDLITIIDVKNNKPIKTVKFKHEVNEIKWDSFGKYLMMTTEYGTVDIYTEDPWELKHTISAHASNAYCIAFDSKGDTFAIGAADSIVSIWSYPEMICFRNITCMEFPVRDLSYSFDGQYLSHASEKKIGISHVPTGEFIFEVPAEGSINTACWHPDQYLLAHAGDEKDKHGYEGAVYVWGL